MKTALYIIRLAGTLLIITALVAAALAGVNAVTEDRIAAATEAKLQAAIGEVLNGASDYTPVEFEDATGTVRNVYISSAGYAVEVAPMGFGGTITMMVGIDPNGTVMGISIVSHTETASLGAVAAATTSAGKEFRDQFIGMSGTLAVDKDGGEVDAITSATITSRAVTEGVNAALECVKNLG